MFLKITSTQFYWTNRLLGAYLVYYFWIQFSEASLYTPDGLFGALNHTPFPNLLLFFNTSFGSHLFLFIALITSSFYMVRGHQSFMAFCLWYQWACVQNYHGLTYPSQGFIGWMLLASTCVPSLRKKHLEHDQQGWEMPTILNHAAWWILGLGYTASGITKALSPSWQNGSALKWVLQSPVMSDSIFVKWLQLIPPLGLTSLTYGILLFELFFFHSF